MIRGSIDIVNEHRLAGWIADISALDVPLTISVFVNDELRVKYSCDMYRQDVFEALGSGDHGFDISLEPITEIGENKLKVVPNNVDFEFAISEYSIRCLADRYSKMVELGRAGWLFLCNDSNEVNEIIQGYRPLSKEMLTHLRRLFSYRQGFVLGHGCKFLQVIVPEKNVICNELKNFPLSISRNRPSIQLMDELMKSSGLNTFYLEDVFLSHANAIDLFFKTDTHLSAQGRIFLMDNILNLLQVPVRYQYVLSLEDFVGDLGVKLEPKVGEQTFGLNVEPKAEVLYDAITPALSSGDQISGKIFHGVNRQSVGQGRIYVYGTSSANQMIKLLCGQFEEVLFSWGSSLDIDLISEFRPDFVLGILAERFLAGPLYDLNMESGLEVLKS